MMRPLARLVFLLVGAATVCLCGCRGDASLVNVSGRVTHQDKPVPNVLVNFIPVNGRPSQAVTDADGRFSYAQYDKDTRGVVAGDVSVVISFIPPEPPPNAVPPYSPPPPPELQPILAKYGNFENPQHRVIIERGKSKLEIKLP